MTSEVVRKVNTGTLCEGIGVIGRVSTWGGKVGQQPGREQNPKRGRCLSLPGVDP